MVSRRPVFTSSIVLVMMTAVVTLAASAAERPWRVVILNGSDPNLPAFIVMDRATRATLAAPGGHAVELFSETLDMMRFPGAQLEPEILALLRKKYADRSIDAVIAVAASALDFAERYHDVLWPQAAIVFHSVAEEVVRGRTLLPRTTGIPLFFDVAGTVELALRLRPDTHQVVVIGGSGDFDRSVLAIAKAQLQPFTKRVAIDYWSDRSIDDFVERIARLPPQTVVVYLSIYRDAGGRVFTPRDAAALLVAASSAPIFSIFDTYIGIGIVAGKVDDYERRGRQAAEMVLATLGSTGGPALPRPAPAASRCAADARELQRWKIAEDLLPDGCAVRFGEPSAWQRYRWQIVTGLAIILSQSLLIAALVLQRRRRHSAELDTQAARAELAHATRLASMGELTASIAHEIKQPLSAILAHADTAELLLESDTPPLAEIQRIIGEIRRDDLRASDVITRLRELLGKHTMERLPLDLNETIRDTLRVLEAEARRRGVTVDTDLASGLPPVVGDRVHFQQVVLNLVLNGMDALAGVAENARRIVVRTAMHERGVEIAVEDNGAGIDPSVASRLFDSFVSTKAHGMGLGLSIARSIVEAHGGTIEAVARAGGGTVIRMLLPTSRRSVEAAAATERAKVAGSTS